MQLDELKDVVLREVWGHEARDFTPWLAKNIEQLSKVIGIQMEVDGTEVAVEHFSADIVVRNPADGSRALIENQLERSDHTHLGQILAYLAGLQAQTVIWVAQDFTESHRSAIRWLNDHTVDPFAFFAVRVRVVQIADSPVAPLFEVLERPSGWDRTVRGRIEGGTSELTEFRRKFWGHYAKRYPNDGVPIGYGASSFWVQIESAGLILAPYLAKGGVGVAVRGRSGELPEAVRVRLKNWEQTLSDELAVEVGEPTSWGSFAASHYSMDATDQGNWPDLADWLHQRIADYRRVLENTPAPSSSNDRLGG